MALKSPLCVDPEHLFPLYFERVRQLHRLTPSAVTFCYSAMHGVGTPAAKKVFQDFGIDKVVFVQEQIEPDPEFPTVVFPNPEEKSSLALAIQTANQHQAQVIVANDPDADRLAVAEKLLEQVSFS